MTSFALYPFLFSLFSVRYNSGQYNESHILQPEKFGAYHQEHEPFSFGRSIVA